MASAALLLAQTRNPYNALPTRTVGHARQSPVTTFNPNFLQGRELLAPQSVAADTSSNPPILYVADTGNNRIMAWRNPGAAAKGAPADLVIGQRDFLTTLVQGPDANTPELRLVAGFNTPTGVAVDANGNLYIADAGNNRILRYPRPFDQQTEILQADLVIGQKVINTGRSGNQGIGPTNKTLLLTTSSALRVGLAIDSQGNLWVADSGNNRILRFPSSQLVSNAIEPQADLVLGQTEFNKNTVVDPQGTTNPQLNKSVLVQPSGIAFDAAGRLFVADSRQRVTMWVPPFRLGMSATRVLGASDEPALSATRLGSVNGPPEGVFTIGNDLYVIDTGNNRILRYGNPDSWAAEAPPVVSPAAISVIGQADFEQNEPNRNVRREARADGFSAPVGATVAGGYIWVADAGNHRVVGIPQNAQGAADRLLGQIDFEFRGPNIVKPNGFNFNSAIGTVGGVAVDFTSDPPRMYVADTGNHRVLGFRDARNVRSGDVPDLVIGQSDYYHSSLNYGSGDPNLVLERGFNTPAGVAVDPNGNLWVADTGNGRVMRFPKPFEATPLIDQRANLCLGQFNCFARPQKEATSRTMSAPVGIAFMVSGDLLVSDAGHNRVLQFRKVNGADYVDGQAAFLVIGQRDFNLSASSSDPDRLNGPRFITIDSSDRLYIADTGNNRVFIRALVGLDRSGAQASYLLNTTAAPTSVSVSRETGNIWVTFPTSNALIRFAEYQALVFDPSPTPAGDSLAAFAPLSIALDPQDNPIVAEGINRIAFFYPRLDVYNAANFNRRLIAPGMLANVGRIAGTFGDVSGTTPDEKFWPTELGDVEVLVDSTPSPIKSVNFDKIQIQVPTTFDAPKEVEILVRRKASGQVLGALTIPTEVVSPGLFSRNDTGAGQVVATNEDGSPNENVNGATRGSTIKIFGTGIGKIPNMPPDGQAPEGEVPADGKPVVAFNGRVLQDSDIKYFGLAPGMVGMFRLDIVVPSNAAVNAANPVGIQWRDFLSRDGFAPGVNVTVWVR
jgi:uncharacterized protein (TIGR03437 family)